MTAMGIFKKRNYKIHRTTKAEMIDTKKHNEYCQRKSQAYSADCCPECAGERRKSHPLILGECLICGWYVGIDDHTDGVGYYPHVDSEHIGD